MCNFGPSCLETGTNIPLSEQQTKFFLLSSLFQFHSGTQIFSKNEVAKSVTGSQTKWPGIPFSLNGKPNLNFSIPEVGVFRSLKSSCQIFSNKYSYLFLEQPGKQPLTFKTFVNFKIFINYLFFKLLLRECFQQSQFGNRVCVGLLKQFSWQNLSAIFR